MRREQHALTQMSLIRCTLDEKAACRGAARPCPPFAGETLFVAGGPGLWLATSLESMSALTLAQGGQRVQAPGAIRLRLSALITQPPVLSNPPCPTGQVTRAPLELADGRKVDGWCLRRSDGETGSDLCFAPGLGLVLAVSRYASHVDRPSPRGSGCARCCCGPASSSSSARPACGSTRSTARAPSSWPRRTASASSADGACRCGGSSPCSRKSCSAT